MNDLSFLDSVVDLDDWRQTVSSGTATDSVVVRKQFVSEIEVSEEDRTVTFVITTGAADREKDVIDPAGWDIKSYLKNPVVLFAHDYDSLPIARTTSLEQQQDKLVATAEFATAELNPMAEQVFQMLRQGFLKGASVGFRPLTFAYNDERGGVDFSQQELLEFSVVPIPANAQALMAAGVKASDISSLTTWAQNILATAQQTQTVKQPLSDQLDDFLDVIRKMMNDIKVSVKDTIKNVDEFQNTFQYSAPRAGDPDITKGISPRNVSETTAPMDTPWRAPTLGDFVKEPWGELTTRQRRNIAGHYAWATAAVPDKFGDMKLPHHRADDGYVIWRGIVAAAGRLDQTRFPSEDMGAVKRHLAAHFKEFDREAPWERDSVAWEAYVKARTDLTEKTDGPISDGEIFALLADYGFSDGLRNETVKDFDREVDETLAQVEAQLASARASLVEYQTMTTTDDCVLELDDEESEDDSMIVNTAELAENMREALHASIGTIVSTEVKSAINAMRGRLD